MVFSPKNREEIDKAIRIYCKDKDSGIKRYGEIGSWDVTKITNMSYLFSKFNYFNEDISNWNVSNVSYMNSMFQDAKLFNQPLNNWDVRNVSDMSYMFCGTESFNQPLNNWYVKNVSDMNHMFFCAEKFNQSLENWIIFNPGGDFVNVENMFLNCEKLRETYYCLEDTPEYENWDNYWKNISNNVIILKN